MPGNNGMFKATVVSRGRVVGLWSRRSTSTATVVTATPFEPPFLGAVTRALKRVARDYSHYLGRPVELVDGTR